MNLLKGLKESILNLDNEPLREKSGAIISPGSIIANALARGKSGEPAKAVSLAIKIYGAGDTIELDLSDLNLAKRAVSNDASLSDLATVAANKVLDEVEIKKVEDKKS